MRIGPAGRGRAGPVRRPYPVRVRNRVAVVPSAPPAPGRRRRAPWALPVLLAAAVLLLAGCVKNDDGTVPPRTPLHLQEVPAIAALVPPEIRASGRLVVGTNPPYAPNEFIGVDGSVVGYDVDLMNAVATVLGLTARYEQADFDKIIPAVQAGTYNVGMSSFTDTLEREQAVDFVTYFDAGIQWAQQAGDDVDPENACGLRVGVQTGTTEDNEEIPAAVAACVEAGRPPIHKIKYLSQADATNALLLGRVDAFSADLPVTAYAIARSDGRLATAGGVRDAAPYGWPVRKGSPLGEALRQAVQHLIDTGAYRTIAEDWGVQAGMITTSRINGAER